MFASDPELFAWALENLYTAVLSDILDEYGLRNQAMHHRLRPLDPENCQMVGRARTIRWMEADYVDTENPYGLEIESIDSLRPGNIIVHSTDFAQSNAPWGELLSTAAKMRGAVGCICDSQIRDCLRIKALRFPIFFRGIRPLDSMGRGRVMAYDVPVRCGDVLVRPGELVFTDFDGIVVVPQSVEADVLQKAAEKAGRENVSREELFQGHSLRDVFNRHGAL